MQRRTLGTREALEGILEDAATPTRAFASDYGYVTVGGIAKPRRRSRERSRPHSPSLRCWILKC